METNKKGTTEDPNIHKQLPETYPKHLVACENSQRGAVAARGSRASRKSDAKEEMGLDWPYPAERSR